MLNVCRRSMTKAMLVTLAVCLFTIAGSASADDSHFPFGCRVREGYVDVPGGKIWYEIVGDGDATPLIVLHGGPGFTHDYLEPLGVLCRERPVVFYDQLGSGKSDRPEDKSLWQIDRFVQEVADLRSALGLKRVHVLGQSWGTMVLTDYALTQPEGVVSLIFSNPVCSYPEFCRDAATYRKQLPAATRDTLDRHEAKGYAQCPEYQGAVLEYYKRHLCRLAVWPDAVERAFAGANQEVYVAMQGPNEFTCTGTLKDWDRTARLKEIKLPSLYIAGRFDETSPRATRLCHNALPGSKMVVFEKSAHMPFFEEPDKYLEVVRDFIHGAEARPAAP